MNPEALPGHLIPIHLTMLVHQVKSMGNTLTFIHKPAECGFDNFVLGAKWEAVPFYVSYGLDCFANIQVTLDKIPWNTMFKLKSKYNITGAAVFGSSISNSLVSKLKRELGTQTKSVTADFESLSIQVKPETITKATLDKIKRDFNAYSVQFAFRREFSS